MFSVFYFSAHFHTPNILMPIYNAIIKFIPYIVLKYNEIGTIICTLSGGFMTDRGIKKTPDGDCLDSFPRWCLFSTLVYLSP